MWKPKISPGRQNSHQFATGTTALWDQSSYFVSNPRIRIQDETKCSYRNWRAKLELDLQQTLQKLLSRPDPVPQLPSLYRCHVTLDLVTDETERLELNRVFPVRPAHNVDFWQHPDAWTNLSPEAEFPVTSDPQPGCGVLIGIRCHGNIVFRNSERDRLQQSRPKQHLASELLQLPFQPTRTKASHTYPLWLTRPQ